MGPFSPALAAEADVLRIASFGGGADLSAVEGPINLLDVDDEPEAPATAFPLGRLGQGAFGVINASYGAPIENSYDARESVADTAAAGGRFEPPAAPVAGASLYLRP